MKITYPRKSWYWQNIANACALWKRYREIGKENHKVAALKWIKIARMFRKRPL